MRTAAKVDANQAAIVSALRGAGATVQSMAAIGKGCPDLLVGLMRPCPHCGEPMLVNLALEVKDGRRPPSERKLTADEIAWHRQWRGQIATVCSVEEALAVIGVEVVQ